MTSIVSAQDLGRVYGEGGAAVDALDGVTVDFPAGAFTAIMGPSGSGKSTLDAPASPAWTGPTSGTVDARRRRARRRSTTTRSPSCAATASASSSRPSTCCRC